MNSFAQLPDVGAVLYIGAIGLIVIGVAGVVMSRNLFRILLALVIAEAGANLLLVLAGFRFDAIAPIITADLLTNVSTSAMVDPIPQAMVLTAIVIGVGIQALALSLIMRVYSRYGTLDIKLLARKLDQAISSEAGIEPADSMDNPPGERPLGVPATLTLPGTLRQETDRQ